MDNLQVLSLGSNLIKKIENLDGVADTLEELWMSYNLVDKLTNIEKLSKLRVLYLSNNKVGAAAAAVRQARHRRRRRTATLLPDLPAPLEHPPACLALLARSRRCRRAVCVAGVVSAVGARPPGQGEGKGRCRCRCLHNAMQGGAEVCAWCNECSRKWKR